MRRDCLLLCLNFSKRIKCSACRCRSTGGSRRLIIANLPTFIKLSLNTAATPNGVVFKHSPLWFLVTPSIGVGYSFCHCQELHNREGEGDFWAKKWRVLLLAKRGDSLVYGLIIAEYTFWLGFSLTFFANAMDTIFI